MSTGEDAPFWFSANRRGTQSVEQYGGHLRASLVRSAEADSCRRWRFGYGLDLIGAMGNASVFNVQQAFVDMQYENARLSLGVKERPLETKNNELSTGGMTFSNNSVPIPQIRFELPKWWNISRKSRLVFIKGHIAYGMLTDGKWQRDNNAGTPNLYSTRSFYHSKAGYMKIGNEERFPLVLSGGLEMVCQYGGKGYNIQSREGELQGDVDLNGGLIKDAFNALIPGGSDVNDGDYSNVGGNQLGSWILSLGWYGKGWSVRAYMDHFFEDHSMMFWQYPWKDNMLGLEVNFPHNPVVSTIVGEYISTMDQSGPIYHDKTEELPDGIYGTDTYYTHHIYGGYQHWGMTMGNPLLHSPLYNTGDRAGWLGSRFSRLTAYHVGLSGDPHPDVHWRVLFTHMRTLGQYTIPTEYPMHGTYCLAEIGYKPHQLNGWKFTLSLGSNAGQTLHTSQGAMLTVCKSGVFNKREVK